MSKATIPVFTTRSIIARESALNKVVHDYEDDWQFLNTEEDLEVSNAIIVSMEEIFNIDSSLEYLIGLMESGTYAKIDDCGKWSIYNLAINVSRYTQRKQNECIVTPKLRNCPILCHDTCKTRFSGVSWHKEGMSPTICGVLEQGVVHTKSANLTACAFHYLLASPWNCTHTFGKIWDRSERDE